MSKPASDHTPLSSAMPRWRRVINLGGRFLLGFIGVMIVVLVCYRIWFMPMFPDLPNYAHAGGAIGDLTYVNGISAFDRSYAKGFRYFEVDFERTSEGTVVCGHDWDDFDDHAPDIETFLLHRSHMQYPPCTLDELIDWFHGHSDATLVSDAKGDVLPIDGALHDGLSAQLLAEAYGIQDVIDFAQVDRNPPILALYKIVGIPARFGNITAMGFTPIQLSAVAMSVTDVWYGMAFWAKIWLHRPVYVYTVNTCGYAPLLHALGVDAIMTDKLDPQGCR